MLAQSLATLNGEVVLVDKNIIQIDNENIAETIGDFGSEIVGFVETRSSIYFLDQLQ